MCISILFCLVYIGNTNGPSHEILVLFVLRNCSSNAHAHASNGARCPMFGLDLCLVLYYMSASSEGSGGTTRMRIHT